MFYEPKMLCDEMNAIPTHEISSILWTRFNVWYPKARAKLERKGISYSTWLSSKKDFFFRRCLPSVVGQKERFDVWYVLFDEESCEADDVIEAIREFDWIQPLRVPRSEGAMSVIRDDVRKRFADRAGFLLSCRLDCDDCLNKHYLSTLLVAVAAWLEINKGALEQTGENLFFSFPFGGRIFQNDLYALYVDTFNNACASVEVLGSENVIGMGNHRQIFKKGKVEFVPTRQPMWLQSIDGSNVSNSSISNVFEYRLGPEIFSAFSIES